MPANPTAPELVTCNGCGAGPTPFVKAGLAHHCGGTWSAPSSPALRAPEGTTLAVHEQLEDKTEKNQRLEPVLVIRPPVLHATITEHPAMSISPAADFAQSFDARVWAAAFVQRVAGNPTIATDESTMVSWFANALMRGYDEHALAASPEELCACCTPPALQRVHNAPVPRELDELRANLVDFATALPSSGAGDEELAKMFHEAYERLAPSFGYETRKASAKPWSEVPEQNRRLMTAVCAEIRAALGRS